MGAEGREVILVGAEGREVILVGAEGREVILVGAEEREVILAGAGGLVPTAVGVAIVRGSVSPTGRDQKPLIPASLPLCSIESTSYPRHGIQTRSLGFSIRDMNRLFAGRGALEQYLESQAGLCRSRFCYASVSSFPESACHSDAS